MDDLQAVQGIARPMNEQRATNPDRNRGERGQNRKRGLLCRLKYVGDALKQGVIRINVICHDLLRHEQSHESGLTLGVRWFAS